MGVLEGPDDEVFSRIYSVKADGDGAIYVFDYGFQEVRVFAPDGTFLRRIGQRGEGPGEFVGAGGIALAPDSTLWVVDYRTQQYSQFSLDGSFLATRRRAVFGAVYPWPGVFENDGALLDRGVVYSDVRSDRKLMTVSIVRVPFAEWPAHDTLIRIRHEHPVVPRNTRPRLPHGPRLKLFFDARARIAWMATSTEYLVYRVTMSGDTTLAFSLDSRPANLSVAERESIASANPIARLPEIPTVRQIVGRLFGDGEYVFVVPQLHSHALDRILDVFTRHGHFVGRLESPIPLYSPTSLSGPSLRNGLLYVPWVDDAGVERVSRLRIVGWKTEELLNGEQR